MSDCRSASGSAVHRAARLLIDRRCKVGKAQSLSFKWDAAFSM
jgi:hypothetical protein